MQLRSDMDVANSTMCAMGQRRHLGYLQKRAVAKNAIASGLDAAMQTLGFVDRQFAAQPLRRAKASNINMKNVGASGPAEDA